MTVIVITEVSITQKTKSVYNINLLLLSNHLFIFSVNGGFQSWKHQIFTKRVMYITWNNRVSEIEVAAMQKSENHFNLNFTINLVSLPGSLTFNFCSPQNRMVQEYLH